MSESKVVREFVGGPADGEKYECGGGTVVLPSIGPMTESAKEYLSGGWEKDLLAAVEKVMFLHRYQCNENGVMVYRETRKQMSWRHGSEFFGQFCGREGCRCNEPIREEIVQCGKDGKEL